MKKSEKNEPNESPQARNRDRVNPQPFERRGNKINDGLHAILPHIPALGLIAAKWSELEKSLGLIYTCLLFGQEMLAYEEYWTTRDFNKRRSKVLAAAAKRLPTDTQTQLRELYDEIGCAVKFRNELLHGQFATCDKKPGFILVWDTKELGDKLNKLFDGLVRIKRNPVKTPSVTVDLSPEHLRAWDQKLIQGLLDWITELEQRASAVWRITLSHSLQGWIESEKQHE